MQLHKRAWRFVSVAALVTFALPMASLSSATPASAQTAQLPPSSISTAGGALVASATPALAFNPIGIQHTVTFTCGAGASGFTGIPPRFVGGCYNVTASVTDITQGTAAAFTSATCGNQPTTVTTGTVNCASYASPICPVGTTATSPTAPAGTPPCAGNPTPVGTTCPTGFTYVPASPGPPATAAACVPNGTTASNTATVTINPGTFHAYLVTFTGYHPATGTAAAPTCAPGETFVPGPFNLSTSGSAPPNEVLVPVTEGVCRFTVAGEKKYVEIVKVTLTGPCTGGPVIFSEGLKSFFGPPCLLTATAYGQLDLKTGVNCAVGGGEPATGTAAPAIYGAGAQYQCVGDTLSVINIPSSLFYPAGLPLTFTSTGPAGVSLTGPTVSLNGLCAGNPATTSVAGSTTGTVYLCPTGFGSGTVQACFTGYPAGTASGGTINTQPTPICSNTLAFTFTAPTNQRVVPQVRWAGEKIVLTKCFGGGGLMAGAPVEFTLQGDTRANATLIPASLPVNGTGGVGGLNGSTATSASQNTVWTVTDVDGCATVIAYARDEGVVSVDAAIFSTTATTFGSAPLINEHAFLVYYLKFDHVDLENITRTTYSTAAALAPDLAFSNSATPAGFFTFPQSVTANTSFTLPNPPGTNPGTGGLYSVPLCPVDYVRAMVHGYFEISGDPSGRPASNVSIPNAPAGAAGSYVLPAGRWVLPEDWPVLATFAGFVGFSNDQTTNNVLQWDLNSGFVFNPNVERAVLCGGPAVPPAKATFGPITAYSVGPCFSQDGYGNPYSTAGLGPNCTGGQTIGIGPFDPGASCTNPFPLTFTPSGSGLITAGPAANPGAFTFGPISTNSTYLPNGALTQWDAPMPPAQVSFGITNGPGFLAEVNKTGQYSIVAGTIFNADGSVKTPGTALYPNPFYAEAIPASPLIPPITNNGGYLWDSFNFRGGSTAGFTTAPAFVPGESTTAAAPAGFATACPPGFTFSSGSTCVSAAGFPPTTCTAIGGTPVFTACTVPTGSITAPGQTGTPGVLAGGTNLSNFGPGCATLPVPGSAAGTYSVVVANGTGFVPGMTVEAYSTTSGAVLVQNLRLTAVTAGPGTGTTLTFSGSNVSPGLCIAAFSAVFVSQQFGIPVPTGSSALFFAGASVGLYTPAGTSASSSVYSSFLGGGAISSAVGGTTYVYLVGAEALARALGGCILSRGPVGGPPAFGTCEPATLAPTGTLVTTGATGGPNSILPIQGPVPNPYPFWQWVPNAAAVARNTAATVYSDNHGEAEVALQSGVAANLLPVAGVCPAGYDPVPTAAAPINCILRFETLGLAFGTTSASGIPGFGTFAAVAAAQAAFSATTPGCLNTTASGATSTATGATAQVGATGPAAGQICINSLGGIEFGPGAALGSTTIQAIADYPYTRGDHAPISSAALTKVFTSAFAKSLNVSAGVAAPAGTTTYTVTITAVDICGSAFGLGLLGEPVNVFAIGNAGAVVLAPLGVGTPLGTNAATVLIGPDNTATLSLEVLSTALGNGGLVIKAVFPRERVERFATVVAGTTAPQTTTVLYTPGYNMVGGPAGSNFSQAEAVFSYNATTGQYTNATSSAASLSSAAPSCTGYYAYFAAAAAVSLPATSKSGDTVTCNLAPGFNLIGNPFASAASLPSGTTAYHFNGTSYDVVSLIPVGGAAFVYNPSSTATTITLTAT